MVPQADRTAEVEGSATSASAAALGPEDGPRPKMVPSWVISIVLHALALVLLGWFLRVDTRSRGIVVEEGAREAGIVLKKISDNREYYEDGAESDESATEVAANTTETNATSIFPSRNEHPADSEALPKLAEAIGRGPESGGGLPSAAELQTGTKQGGDGGAEGPYAKVNIYGAEAEGSKFVFVFDRSVSMDGEPLASAKRELIQGIQGLKSTHQFHIIFFNQEPRSFQLGPGGRLPFADDQTKKLAEKFVGGITAAGGTNRMSALSMAMKTKPDVIFFLTDADDPLSATDVDSIFRNNGGITSINTIEFGYGPNPGGANFLTRMAAQNSGKYVYVDTSLLER
jgi:hypothetical protein